MNMCRICLVELDGISTVQVQTIANLLQFCVPIKITPNDKLPQLVCVPCGDKATEAYKFKILCEESDMYLRSAQMLNFNKPKPKFRCGSCDMVFVYKRRFLIHTQKHQSGFVCKECGKAYPTARDLAVHVSIEKRKGAHPCETCGKEFTMPENLKRHQRVHDGIRKFTCRICDKSFTQSNELQSHSICHTDEKNYLCSFCGHKYARKRSLQVHIMRIHQANDKFMCSSCGSCFKGLVDMKMHEVIHSDEKKHVCGVCGKGFNKRSNLTVHERIHTGQKPFACHICAKAFVQKHVLTKHLLVTHP